MCVGAQSLQSCPTLCNTWTAAHQVPLSIVLSRQEYKCGLPFPSSGDLPNPGIKPESPALQVDFLLLSHRGNIYIYVTKSFCYTAEINIPLLIKYTLKKHTIQVGSYWFIKYHLYKK